MNKTNLNIFFTITLFLFTCSKKAEINNQPIQDLVLYPPYTSVFESDIDNCKEVLFPIATIHLGSINEAWKGEKVHLILYNEDPYNTKRVQYFNEYCKDYMVAFDVVDGKYTFKTDFGYFDLREEWKQWFDETKASYLQSKKQYQEKRTTYENESFKLGGKPEWWQSDETPLDPDGRPMDFISEFDYNGVKFFLFYSHKYKLAVQIYQIT